MLYEWIGGSEGHFGTFFLGMTKFTAILQFLCRWLHRNRGACRVNDWVPDDAALSTVSEISQNLQIIGVTNVASSHAMIAIPLPMER